MDDLSVKIAASVAGLQKKITAPPEIALILGSGLSTMAEDIEAKYYIPYMDIPHMPISTVEGHINQFVVGQLMGKKVIAMQGRFHYYEGYNLQEVTYPIRVIKQLGIEVLIVTNAAGGINKKFQVADLMLIEDHINLMGNNPLIGPNDSSMGPRFPDMNEAYNLKLRQIAENEAIKQGITLQKGVYAGLTGPTYETPAEVRYLRTIGADAVGMSTVPEVIVAKYLGIKVLGISCITNLAAGLLEQPLSHEEVMAVGIKVRDKFSRLIKGIIHEV